MCRATLEWWKTSRRTSMKVGDIVEDFSALDQQGEAVTLSGLLDSGPVVLYFYIKAKTPG